MKRAVLSLILAAAAAPAIPGLAWAQTSGPTPDQIVRQQQANLNRFQAQLQSDQLQQLQRQNSASLLQPSRSGFQADAATRQWEIQNQIDQNTALQQRMASPGVDPADIHAQIQQDGDRIDQLQQQQSIPRIP